MRINIRSFPYHARIKFAFIFAIGLEMICDGDAIALSFGLRFLRHA